MRGDDLHHRHPENTGKLPIDRTSEGKIMHRSPTWNLAVRALKVGSDINKETRRGGQGRKGAGVEQVGFL